MPVRLSNPMQIRLLLASLGALFAAVGFAWTRLSETILGHCLTASAPAAAHCPWCYVAAACLTLAVLPWSRPGLFAAPRAAIGT